MTRNWNDGEKKSMLKNPHLNLEGESITSL